jgi:drug/metabolite transporter (DMT)-like permease
MFMILSAACFAGTHITVRHLSADIHPFEAAVARNVVGLILLSPWLLKNHMENLKTKRFKLHLFRGVTNSGFMLMFFLSLSLLPVAEATSINFTAPLFVTLLAALVLREKVGWRRWTALLIGFVGALVIIRPGVIPFNYGSLLVMLASMSWAVSTICLKPLMKTESSVTCAAYISIIVMPISIVFAIPFWVWPTLEQFGFLVIIAALATVAQLCLSEAMKWADASAVTPFDFTRLIFAAGLGFVFFGHVPDIWIWAGAIIIFTSTTFIVWRESSVKKAS